MTEDPWTLIITDPRGKEIARLAIEEELIEALIAVGVRHAIERFIKDQAYGG